MAAVTPLPEPGQGDRVGFGPFAFDALTGELWRQGEKLHLRPQAQQILGLLLRRPGILVTREELRSTLSGGAAFGAFDQAVNDAIREIRATLQDPAQSPRFIETLPRRGYRFVAAVGVAEPLPPEAPAESYGAAGLARRRRVPWALVLVALALAGSWLALRARPSRVRVLVLPIVSVGDQTDQHLAAGLTEELISQFGSLAPESLGAIARTTAFRYQGVRRPAAEIGRELQVDYLVEGALRREGGGVRIDVRLVEARGEATLWSQTFERSLGDVLALQADIAFAVSRRVGIVMGPSVRRPPPPLAPQAAEALLRARSLWATREIERLREAVAELESVVHAAPDHGPALGLLSQVLLTQADLASEGRAAQRTRAIELADRALALDDGLAEAHAARGLAALLGANGWRLAEAERSLQRALALNPSHAPSRLWLSSLLRFRGLHSEALVEAHRALELDPLSPTIAHNFANALLYSGDPQAAIAQYQHVLELAPTFAPAQRGIARALEAQGRLAEALEASQRARVMAQRPTQPEYLADVVYCLARLGRRQEANEMVNELEAVSASWPFSLAVAALALGQRERSLDLLERAYVERDPQFRLAGIDPRLRDLSGDARYLALLHRSGLR